MPHFPDEMEYSYKYKDECYEYRHIILTKKQFKIIRDIPGLIPEDIWRNKLDIHVSKGWKNYARYPGEPYIILLRRPIGTDPQTGIVPEDILTKIELFEKKRVAHLNVVNPDIKYEEYALSNL